MQGQQQLLVAPHLVSAGGLLGEGFPSHHQTSQVPPAVGMLAHLQHGCICTAQRGAGRKCVIQRWPQNYCREVVSSSAQLQTGKKKQAKKAICWCCAGEQGANSGGFDQPGPCLHLEDLDKELCFHSMRKVSIPWFMTFIGLQILKYAN